MGELHTLASDLPTPSKFDALQQRARVASDLWGAAYGAEQNGLEEQRVWLEQYAAFAPMLASLSRDIGTISRPATRAEIADALTMLRDALHASKTPTAASNRLMAERVGSQQPTYGALKIAVLYLIDTREWFPPIAVVLDALATAKASLSHTAQAIEIMPKLFDRVSIAFAESQRAQALESQRRAERIAYHRNQQAPA